MKLILSQPRFTLANALAEEMKNTAVTYAAFHRKWDVLKELVHHPSIDLETKDVDGLCIDDILG